MIHIVATSANIEKNYDQRKDEYIKGLESIRLHYQKDPWIIECIKHVDYFPEYFLGKKDLYENKGNEEFANIELFFNEHGHRFNSQDVIIKHTMRYEITSSHLLECIENNPGYDAYVKSSADIYGPQDTGVHVFLFAMTYNCWKEFLSNNFDRTTHKDYPIEAQVSAYLSKKNTKFLDKLGVRAALSWHGNADTPRIHNV